MFQNTGESIEKKTSCWLAGLKEVKMIDWNLIWFDLKKQRQGQPMLTLTYKQIKVNATKKKKKKELFYFLFLFNRNAKKEGINCKKTKTNLSNAFHRQYA